MSASRLGEWQPAAWAMSGAAYLRAGLFSMEHHVHEESTVTAELQPRVQTQRSALQDA